MKRDRLPGREELVRAVKPFVELGWTPDEVAEVVKNLRLHALREIRQKISALEEEYARIAETPAGPPETERET